MSLSVLVVGDIMIGEPESRALGQKNGLPGAAPLSRAADLLFGNLEVPLSDRGNRADKLVAWRSSPKLAPILRDLGFDVLSLANNHIMDYGVQALDDTVEVLTKAGIQTVGAGDNLDEALTAVTYKRGEDRIAFLAVSCTLPLGSAAALDRPGLAPIRVATSYTVDPTQLQEQPGTMPHVQTWAEEDDVEVVTQLIKRLKTEDYAVILSIHWGVAFEEQLADYQRPLAHSLVDAGADFVAGHHPHVIQGIEIYDARAIFYSLSNFIMHDSLISPAKAQVPHSIRSHWMMSRDAATARLTIDGGRITEVAIVPVHIGPDGFGRWAIGERAQGILNHTRSLSEAFGTQWAELERGEPASVLLG